MQKQTTNNITTIKTEKFKTTTIKIAFKAPLGRKTVTQRILLANVLRNSSKKFGSKKVLNAHLENLYGANLAENAKKQGKVHIISFYMQVANEKFLKSAPPLFEEALMTLKEVLMNPKIENGAFDTAVVEQEMRLLKEDIESIYDDKTTYALKKLLANMCEEENFGVSGDGYISDLELIDAKSLVAAYESMFWQDEIDIVVLGDVEHEEVVQLFESQFDLKYEMRANIAAVDKEEKVVNDVTVLQEEQLVNQTKLNIGYRTNTRIIDPDYFSLLVFNGVFGAFAHSKLFMNVREKESLCYYCASQLDNFKGLMYVYSGLDLAQVPKAIEIIDKQLVDICCGNITENELTLAKKSIINAKRESLDSASGMLSDLEMAGLLGLSVEGFIEKIDSITADEVIHVAKKIKKDTIFTLKPCASKEES